MLASWRAKYGSVINSGIGLYNFLEDQLRESLPVSDDLVSIPILNKNLLDYAMELHDTKLDNWIPPNGVSLTEIAGWGEETLSGIEYYQGISTKCEIPSGLFDCLKYSTSSVLEYNPIITTDGDGTVVVPSALWIASSTDVSKYWVNLDKYGGSYFGSTINRKHADILEIDELRDFINNLIIQSSSTLPEYISTSTPIKLGKRLKFILHSPLSLNLYDGDGNHTGISTTTNELEENIPGSHYITFGEVKYISVPASSNIYISMRGYDSGSFTLNIEEVEGNNVIASTTFAGVPSSTSTIATISILNGNISSTSPLNIDKNGDGIFDITLTSKVGEIVIPDLSIIEDKTISKITRRNRKFVIENIIESTTTEIILENKIIMEQIVATSSTNNELLESIPDQPKENLIQNKIISRIETKTKKSIINNKVDNKNTIIKSSNNQDYTASVGGISLNNKIMSIISNIFFYIGKRINILFNMI